MELFLVIRFHFHRIVCLFVHSICFLLVPIGVSGCSVNRPAPLTPITVQLSWLHQAQFSGFYAADQQGYYAEEGLDVSFIEGGLDVDFIAPLINGTAQFGVAQPADVILARAANKPIRSIAAIYRRSPIVFFSQADLGITRPQDFVGKKIRTAVTIDQTLYAMTSKLGITADQYETVYLPSDIEQFVSGDVPIWGGFINVFVVEVQRAGYKINIISPDDYGIHFYGDILITSDDFISNNQEIVRRCTRATLMGWRYAIENPEMVGEYVQEYNPNADPDQESEKMIKTIPLVNTGEDYIGWMKTETWEVMAQTLREQGVLTQPLDINQVYTMQFLKAIYHQ